MSSTERSSEAGPNRCPACNQDVTIEAKGTFEDTQCPHCGRPLLFLIQELKKDSTTITVLSFVNRSALEELHVEQFGEELTDLVDGPRNLLLDFSNVEFIASSALAKLIGMHKKVQSVQGKMLLCCMRDPIQEVFEVTQLNRIFEIVDEMPQALDQF